ncbi:MAG: NitT/TauT family transport system substrate-binding protein [Candidatus Binatota bacterium]|jgi:NitT/TauT family transport system substrate-binding protein|nr:NitT/TauT family transport system substrate-binding protein [Candidatus Binatota bacterium]
MKLKPPGFLIAVLVSVIGFASALVAADKLNTSYISTTPGSSSVLWIAKDAKIFDKHGIDATVIFISGSVRGIQSILAGEIAIGEGGGPGLASARLAGGDVVAIAGNVNVLPYYLVSQPTIKKPEDLRGKIGGTHIAGTTAEFALKVGLKRIGIDPLKDVNLRVIGGAIERMVALQKGIVNFTVVTEAGKAMAERLGYPTIVDMVALQIPFPQNGIYTSTKLIRENPDFVRRYLRAYVEAIYYFKTHKEETLRIMRKYSRLEDRKILEEAWDWHTKFMPEAPYAPAEGYQLVLQDIAEKNPKAAQANVKDYIDTRFIKELEDSGFIKNLSRK